MTRDEAIARMRTLTKRIDSEMVALSHGTPGEALMAGARIEAASDELAELREFYPDVTLQEVYADA